MTLNPNQTATLQVQFDPSAAGPAAGQLTVTSNSTTGATTLVSLSGNGTVAASPAADGEHELACPSAMYGELTVPRFR